MPTKDPEKIKAKNAKYDAKRAGRTRNFATVVYPESAPADWMELLDEQHVAALISPLHDRDTNPSGEPKKPHYHVLLMFDGVKDFETQVKPIFDAIGGVGREAVNSMRGYARYLCHLDNPEKAQYSPDNVRQLGGAVYREIISLPTDDLNTLKEIFAYVREQQIFSLAELLDIAAVHYPDWYAVIAMSRAYIVDKYLKSLEWEAATQYVRAAQRIKVDTESGEVIED